MIFPFILLAWAFVVITAAVVSAAKSRRNAHTISDDGHVVPPGQDLTCENQYGHQHAPVPGTERRYIVHEDPEEGYVILNGVKRKLKDCKYL